MNIPRLWHDVAGLSTAGGLLPTAVEPTWVFVAPAITAGASALGHSLRSRAFSALLNLELRRVDGGVAPCDEVQGVSPRAVAGRLQVEGVPAKAGVVAEIEVRVRVP